MNTIKYRTNIGMSVLSRVDLTLFCSVIEKGCCCIDLNMETPSADHNTACLKPRLSWLCLPPAALSPLKLVLNYYVNVTSCL